VDAGELADLHKPRTYPAVSVIMPTHRRQPENKQDPVRLKSLLDEARRRLREEKHDLPRGVADEVMATLEKAADQVNLAHAAEALVLLAAPGGEQHAYVLPRVNVTERVIIDDTFATRDLVAMLERSWNYWVLVLSEQPTRLWSGDGERLVEVSDALFPLLFEDSLPDERGPVPLRKEAVTFQDDRRMRFFRQVERNLNEVLKRDSRPVIVLGVSRYLKYLDEVAGGPVKDAIIGTAEGSFDKASASELATLADPILVAEHERWQRQAVDDLDKARSTRRFAGGLEEVWELAGQGRIAHLVVEEGHLVPARTGQGRLLPADAPESEGKPVSDAVDDLIETVLRADGQIMLVPDGALADHGHIAAALRF
jgi:hypothetical protein